MGSITERAKKDGSLTYQAMVKISGGKAIVKSFPSRELATTFINSIEADKKAFFAAKEQKEKAERQRLESRTPDEKRMAFEEEIVKDVLKLYAKDERCIPRHFSHIPSILPHLGDLKIKEIKKSWTRKYLSTLRATMTYRGTPYAWSTINLHLIILSIAIKWRAEELDVRPPDLPFSTKLFPANWDTRRDRRLDRHEELALIRHIRKIQTPSMHHWRHILRLALETGARQQELVYAEWSEFDLNRRVWTIPAAHTKTRRTRVVPLSKAAMRALRMLQIMASPNDTRIFHLLSSKGVVCSMFYRFFKELGFKDIKFHDLRHEAISRMILYKRGLSVYEIMAIVGHSSLEMLNRYANLRGDELVKNMN